MANARPDVGYLLFSLLATATPLCSGKEAVLGFRSSEAPGARTNRKRVNPRGMDEL